MFQAGPTDSRAIPARSKVASTAGRKLLIAALKAKLLALLHRVDKGRVEGLDLARRGILRVGPPESAETT